MGFARCSEVARAPRDVLNDTVYFERTQSCVSFEAAVNFMKREDGPTAVEYAVMLALIIVVCITAITALGTNANKTFTSVSSTIGGAS